MVAINAMIWWDFNATGGSAFDFSNMVAGVGHAWGAAPAYYATAYMTLPYNHVEAMCVVTPKGC
jgi:hypothetical protein